MKVLLSGVPGAGKGAQARFIIVAFGIPQVSTGDMLRAAIRAGASLGLEAKKIIDEGGLVCDDIIIGVVRERVAQDDCKNSFLFDGFPCTLAQAEAMVEVDVDLNAVVEIGILNSVIVDRMSGRRVHLASGRTHHVTYNLPEVGSKDDATGEDLIQRNDDKEETAKKHLAVYHEQTEVLVDFYSKLEGEHVPKYIRVDGAQSVEAVKAEVLGVLDK